MQKRTREIIALVLLVVLGLGVASVMCWYMLVGHNWNVTATNIDDSIGQLKGYTVFLVNGNKEIPREDSATSDQATEEATDSGSSESEDAASAEGIDEAAQAQEESSTNSSASETEGDQSSNTPDVLGEENTIETASGQTIRTIDELIEEYQGKGAEVLVIESADDSDAKDLVTYRSGLQRVGVFKIDDPVRPAAVKVGTKLLGKYRTDFNILVTDDQTLEGAALEDVGLIVFNGKDGTCENGRYSGYSYCVDTPFEGQVEAVIVAPSGVISSKVIDL